MHFALTFFLLAASPTETIQARDAEIRTVLPPPGTEVSPEVREKAETLLTRIVDMPGMAEAALGKKFKSLTPAQKRRYLDAFTSRFKKATAEQIDFYRSTEIKYLP